MGDGRRIRVFHFLRGELATELEASVRTGHAGGDMGLVEAVERGDPSLLEPFAEAVEVHRLTFLAERAHKEARVVEVEGGN